MTPYRIAELDAHWRAANYLAAGQIYLLDNPLLTEPLRPEHIKPRLLGHWGTAPGLNFVHTHLNRVIKERSLEALCVWGPGHGGAAVLANSWLEGTYTETYPDIGRDADGMRRLFRQFSFPGGVPSHVAPETPGSIHEGGELGYALAHAYGAAFDHPGLLVACVIGDGEAETGPLAASWHSNKFLDPVHDGAVLPILHLNGYKIANPTLLSRIPEQELDALLRGYGHDPLYVSGSDPALVHPAMARALDQALDRIHAIQREARAAGTDPGAERARRPMIVLRTPKGWTGPAAVDGQPVEGTWRAHQVPLTGVREDPGRLRQLESWMRSYRPEELFGAGGRPVSAVLACVPEGERRLGASPYANGGRLLRSLPLPGLDAWAVPVEKPGSTLHEPTRVLGRYLAQVMGATAGRRDFRVVGPDETASNHLDDLPRLDEAALATLFARARTANSFADTPVSDEELRGIWELARWAPAEASSQPLCILYIRAPEGRARVMKHLAEGNRPMSASAPAIAALAADTQFHEHIPELLPFRPGAWEVFEADTEKRKSVAHYNSALQTGYFQRLPRLEHEQVITWA